MNKKLEQRARALAYKDWKIKKRQTNKQLFNKELKPSQQKVFNKAYHNYQDDLTRFWTVFQAIKDEFPEQADYIDHYTWSELTKN